MKTLSFRNYQLLIVLQLVVCAHDPLLFPYWYVDWLDLLHILCKQPQLLLWVHESYGLVVPRRHSFLLVSGFSNLSTCPSQKVQEPWVEGHDTKVLLVAEQLLTLTLCTWISCELPLLVNHFPLQKEASLVRSECSSNLRVLRCKFRGQFDPKSI